MKTIGKFKLRLILCLQTIFDFFPIYLSMHPDRTIICLFKFSRFHRFFIVTLRLLSHFPAFFAHFAIGCNLTRWSCFRYFCAWLFTSSSSTFLKSGNIHQVKVWRELFFVWKCNLEENLFIFKPQEIYKFQVQFRFRFSEIYFNWRITSKRLDLR